jgi:hypothetical protein
MASAPAAASQPSQAPAPVCARPPCTSAPCATGRGDDQLMPDEQPTAPPGGTGCGRYVGPGVGCGAEQPGAGFGGGGFGPGGTGFGEPSGGGGMAGPPASTS